MAINFLNNPKVGDNVKIEVGNSSDLQISHNGTDSQITNLTGNLQFTQLANDKNITFANDNGSGGDTVYLTIDGDNRIIKFDKNTVHPDGVKGLFGTSFDLQIYHDGSNSFIQDSGTGDLFVLANNLRLANADNSGQFINANNGGAVEIFHNNSKKFETTSTGVLVSSNLTLNGSSLISSNTADGSDNAQIVISGGGASGDTRGASVHISGNESGNAGLLQLRAGSGSVSEIRSYTGGSERIRVNSSGNVGINTTSPTNKLTISDNSAQILLIDTSTDNKGEIEIGDADFTFNLDRSGAISSGKFAWRIDDTTRMELGLDDADLGQLRLNEYGSGNITGTVTQLLGVDENGYIIETSTSGGGTVTGSGAATRVAFWSGTSALSSDANLYWDNSNDRLGIGTSAPGAKLDVRGDGAGFFLQSADHKIARIQPRGTGAEIDKGLFSLFTTTTETVRIDTNGSSWFSGGKIGIGTTSPSRQLHIKSTSGDTRGIMIEKTVTTSYAELQVKAASEFRLGTAGSATGIGGQFYIYDATANAHRFDIDSSGNIGIGTTSPNSFSGQRSLTINGTDNSRLDLQIAGSNKGEVSTSAGALFLIHKTGDIRFQPGNAFQMIVKSGGNVGIGTTNPTAKLEVSGDITATGADFTLAHASGATVFLRRDDTSISDGNVLGLINFQGDDPTDGTFNTGVALMGKAAGDWASGSYESEFLLQTRNTSGGLVTALTINEAQNATFAGVISAAGGNAAAPSIIFEGNTDTGFFHPATDEIGFSTAGSERMRIDDSGNVGIGTTAPTGKLEVQKSQVTTQFDRDCFLRLHPTATTDEGGLTNIFFGTSTTNNFGVAVGGRKGGAGDTSSTNNPEFSVRILNDAITGTEVLNINTAGNATFAGTVTAGSYFLGDDTSISLATTGAGTVFLRPNGQSTSGQMKVESNGNATFTGGVTVNGDVLVEDATPVIIIKDSNATTPSNTIGYVSMQEADGTEVAFMGMGSGSNSHLYLAGAAGTDVMIRTNATTAMFIDTNQRVGIGTTAPGAKLEVVGDSRIYDNLNVGYRSVTSSTTNYESTLILSGKNNYSDGTTWYGSYGQLLFTSDSNMSSSARRFLITNALDNNKFAIVRSTNADTTPVVNSTSTGINSGTADFVIDNSGKIGIGATSPDTQLDVRGEISVAYNASYGLRFYNNARNNWSSIGNNIASGTAANLVFKDSTGEVMRITGGEVGIGTTSPQGKVHISATSTQLVLETPNATNDIDFRFRENGSNKWNFRYQNSSNALEFINQTGTALTQLSLKADGDVQARRPRSNTAGDVALSIQPTDSTIHYGFRIDQATNSFNLDRSGTNLQLLRVDTSGNATFAGDVTIGSSGAGSDRILNVLTGGSKSIVKLMEAGTVYGFSTLYDGATNKFHINRHNNSAAGTSVLSFNRDDNNATFSGDVNVQDNLYLQDGSTVRAKIQLNSSDRDDLDIKAVSLGSNMKFFTVDTERMRINSGGNVGIGTSNMQAKLTVQGQLRSSANIVSNSGYDAFYIGSTRSINDYGGLYKNYFTMKLQTPAGAHAYGDLRFQLANSNTTTAEIDVMTLSYTGKVGIGTTSPSYKLTVNDSTANGRGIQVVQSATSGINYGIQGGAFGSGATKNIGLSITAEGATTNDAAHFMGGNVGIGTTSPGAKLDIKTGTDTNALFIREDTDNSITHNFYVDSSDNGRAVLYANGQLARIELNTAGDTYFNGGDVGIGTTAPNVKLHVVGTTKLGGALHVSSDANFNTSASYTFRDAVFINNPNDTSAPASSNTVMMIGGMSGNSVKTSLITTAAIGISTTAPSAGLHLDQKTNDRAGGVYIERSGSNYGISAFVNSGGFGVIGSNGTYTKDILRLNLSTGNVGLGGVNPSSLLHLQNASSPTIRIVDTTNSVTLLAFSQDSNAHVGTFSNHDLVFDSNSTERMRITSVGSVGIGTSSPSHMLSVNGTFKYGSGLEQSGAVSSSEPSDPPDFTPSAWLDIKVNGSDYLIPLFEKGS